MKSQRDEAVASAITPDDLARVSRTKVFFGHRSVGMNVLEGIPGIYTAHGMRSPTIEQESTGPGQDGGFVAHAFIVQSGRPLLKIQDFDAKMRSGTGQQVDVAMMKFCYNDITARTDVEALFASYGKTMAALQRDFPKVAFTHVTVPLTTGQGLLSKLKNRLTGSSGDSAANNARERLSALIRHEYADEHLFDLAAIESTAPDGSRAIDTHQGQRSYRLYDGYASDSGHLNGEGARVAATAWLKAIAQASLK
ncbi:MAG: hypothetical protein ACLP8X_15535 [Streptosporangiaceae bacterium]